MSINSNNVVGNRNVYQPCVFLFFFNALERKATYNASKSNARSMDLDLFTPHDAKEQGNRFFKSGHFDKAIQSYSKCIELFKKEQSVEALLQVSKLRKVN